MIRYPNPANVITPTTAPPPFPPQLTSRGPTPFEAASKRFLFPIHDHCAFVDSNGDGVTDVVASHYHRVIGGVIRPDESDGHTHELTGLPCGAG